MTLKAATGARIPIYLSITGLPGTELPSFCLAATDLTDQKRNEELVAAERLHARFSNKLQRQSL